MIAPAGPDVEAPAVSTNARLINRGIPKGTLLANTYLVEEPLGSGGMAEVYLARHKTQHTLHAVKVIHASMEGNTMATDLFNREARILQDVNHDAVVRYQGSPLDAEGHVFLIMEYVQGISLSQRLKERALTAEEVICLRDRLCAGLAEVHRKGVIHRDLSPDNVILPAGRIDAAKIIDFGLSKSTDADQQTILVDTFAGKYRYASPEQFGLYGGEVDSRSDIYSLGLTLAAAARGRPFEMGMSLAAARKCRERVPDLSQLPPEVSDWLRAMLEPNPAKRLRSVELISRTSPRRTTSFPYLRLLLVLALIAVLAWLGHDWITRQILGPRTPEIGPAQHASADVLGQGTAADEPGRRLVSVPVSPAPPSGPPAYHDNALVAVTAATATGDGDPGGNGSVQGAVDTVPPRPATPSRPVPMMVTLPAGCFSMGSGSDAESYPDESPHQVCVQRFGIAQHEISLSEFKWFVEATGYRTAAERADQVTAGCFTFLESPASKNWGVFVTHHWQHPGFRQDDTEPVVCVNLVDTQAYIDWLNGITGRRFRLPTEAEWEYAARAGTATRYPWGDALTWVSANFSDATRPPDQEPVRDGFDYTAPRGRFAPNPWTLYDMLGNVSEWTCSLYSAGYDGSESRCAPEGSGAERFATRGGSWSDPAKWLRAAAREPLPPLERRSTLGFRIAEDLDARPDPGQPHSEP